MGLMLSLFLATGLAGEAPGGPATCERPLHLSGATLRVDGEPVLGPFSLLQSRAGYLFLYIPGRGLAVVASRPFERAERAGEFRGRTLVFSAGGADMRLESATAILGADACGAWVRHEPGYLLNIQEPLYGYGDSFSVAEEWRRQFGLRDG